MISRNQLSDAERKEWDAVFDAACFDEYGKNHSTPIATANLADEIDRAIAQGKWWAECLSDDSRQQGLQKLIKPWQNQRHFHTTPSGEQKLVKRSNIARIKKVRNKVAEMTSELWEDCSADDLLAIAQAADSRIASESITRRDALRCASLTIEQNAATCGEALTKAGYASLDDFLQSKASA